MLLEAGAMLAPPAIPRARRRCRTAPRASVPSYWAGVSGARATDVKGKFGLTWDHPDAGGHTGAPRMGMAPNQCPNRSTGRGQVHCVSNDEESGFHLTPFSDSPPPQPYPCRTGSIQIPRPRGTIPETGAVAAGSAPPPRHRRRGGRRTSTDIRSTGWRSYLPPRARRLPPPSDRPHA